ncbi:MAG: transposase [Candidatus Omnitrophota bacterium]|nr:transposase [Candidatus Omnitrophota bacterium]
MPRTARIVIDGGTYHVLTRGNNGQPVFHGDPDFQRYLQVLSTYAREHQLKVYHFVLMPNQVHLVFEVARGESLSKAMLGLNLTYALYYRKRHRYSGHLWQGRFKSLLIDPERHLLACGRYVELNPVRTGLVTDPTAYPWSSYRAYAEGVDTPLLAPHPRYEALGASGGERQRAYRQWIQEGLTPRQPPVPTGHRHLLMRGTAYPVTRLEELLGFPPLTRRQGRPRKLEVATDDSSSA